MENWGGRDEEGRLVGHCEVLGGMGGGAARGWMGRLCGGDSWL